MKKIVFMSLYLAVLLLVSGCNSETKQSILYKCTTLGDESIVYARANYVKLFHYFNPGKFEQTYQQVADFDHITHRNVINTYDMAVRKIKPRDPTTKAFLTACKNLAKFSKNLVDQAYPRAIAHQSKNKTSSNDFFIEINQIVKFDHNIGAFDQQQVSFKQVVIDYKKALKNYIEKFQLEMNSTKNKQ